MEIMNDTLFKVLLFIFGVIFGGAASFLFSWLLFDTYWFHCVITTGGMVMGGIIGGPVVSVLRMVDHSFDKQAPNEAASKHFEL